MQDDTNPNESRHERAEGARAVLAGALARAVREASLIEHDGGRLTAAAREAAQDAGEAARDALVPPAELLAALDAEMRRQEAELDDDLRAALAAQLLRARIAGPDAPEGGDER